LPERVDELREGVEAAVAERSLRTGPISGEDLASEMAAEVKLQVCPAHASRTCCQCALSPLPPCRAVDRDTSPGQTPVLKGWSVVLFRNKGYCEQTRSVSVFLN